MYGRPMPDYADAGPLSAYGVRRAGERAGHIYDWKCVETYAAIKESLSELSRKECMRDCMSVAPSPHAALPCAGRRAGAGLIRCGKHSRDGGTWTASAGDSGSVAPHPDKACEAVTSAQGSSGDRHRQAAHALWARALTRRGTDSTTSCERASSGRRQKAARMASASAAPPTSLAAASSSACARKLSCAQHGRLGTENAGHNAACSTGYKRSLLAGRLSRDASCAPPQP